MTNLNKNSMKSEQIKNESIKVLEENINHTNIKIQTLNNLKLKSEQILKKLVDQKNSKISQNKKLKESLIKKLNLKVVVK